MQYAATRSMSELPWWLSGKEAACQGSRHGSTLVQEDALEKEMVTHSSILAWEIPWTGKSGGQQSMRLQDLDMT